MPGLEIVGVVLGALPVAIEAARAYRDTLSAFRNAKKAMDDLVLDLETERLILRDTCELLLDGIAQPDEIISMIENPLGPEWKSYEKQLGLKLWESVHVFDEHVKHMLEATQALKLRLGIEEGSQVNPSDKRSVLEAFKTNASFAWRRPDYDQILSRIRTSNMYLQRLSQLNRELEPSRSIKSRSRATKLMSRLSSSVYNAMCGAIGCPCASSHSIGLRLTHEDLIMLPEDTEEEVGRKLKFHVALRTAEVAKKHSSSHQLQHHDEAQLSIRWSDFHLRLMNLETPRPDPPTPQPSPQSNVRWIARVLPPRPSTSSSVVQPVSSPTTKNEAVLSPKASDLCDAIQRKSNTKAASRHGYVVDIEQKFELSLQDGLDLDNSTSLRRIIDGSSSGLPPFGIEEKIEAVLALSSSIPHLYGTPWLPRILTLDDVELLFNNEARTDRRRHPSYHPSVAKCVPSTLLSQTNTRPTTRPTPTLVLGRAMDLTVFSLGLLLIQIIIGYVDKRLEMVNNVDANSIISKRVICGRPELTERILLSGGQDYSDIVSWCLDSLFHAGLGNEDFRQRFYEAVVVPLERTTKNFRNM
ncbi:hypothetical protein F4861DRAFT_244948 [Xylaria intraflava]|nr:hypothetical protein F4861DRAFT_244948 [Xylaria intraflava]